jgi:carbon-monoxide dehydrogenase small subunit
MTAYRSASRPQADGQNLSVRFTLNGRALDVRTESNAVLADVLREELGLTGTKISCDQGLCGACTVIIDGKPVASCTEFMFMAEGRAVTTIEGLGTPTALHPVQQAFVEAAALQCGFCTPGMVLMLGAMLAENPDPDEATLRLWLSSNVCRCTGYQPILDAALIAARRYRETGSGDARA